MRVTVPITAVDEPPTTTVGDTVKLVKLEGKTETVHVWEVVPWVAVTVAVTCAFTTVVVQTNVALVAPAAIVTVEGTLTVVLFDARETTRPPGGAFPFTDTAPVA